MDGSEGSRWRRYRDHLVTEPELGIALDVSRVGFAADHFEALAPDLAKAFEAMAALEAEALANRDEKRMVGHYWLRAPELAPEAAIGAAIRETRAAVRSFAEAVRAGPFEHVLHLGIGGSALGPQLLCAALGGDEPEAGLPVRFVDNTDPDGIARALAALDGALERTIVTVASKSGGTPEPRNAMVAARAAYERAGLDAGPHFVAVTGPGSPLDELARREGWRARFPVWDWVGGRTSVTSATGLVPAALHGIDVDAFLAGAAAMDRWTRRPEARGNPAALLALAWHHLGAGRGAKDMVVLPYADRLELLGRYLQQLVMESIGKARDRRGRTVHQGLTVYGNKGSTDQHAFVQQLRDGPRDFFVTFVQVLDDGAGAALEVEPGVTAGDYLLGFLEGTREALSDEGRASITITLDRLSPATLGGLIALYERAVGLYAELIDVNAYDQPGVEAGKRAAAAVLDVQRRVVAHLAERAGEAGPGGASAGATAGAIADAIGPSDPETVFKVLRHLAANGRGIVMERADDPAETTFRAARASN